MILKKPYAFLIKHFKIIHVLLTLLMSFVFYKSYSVMSFFSEYIKNNYMISTYEGFSSDYIPFLLFFMVIIILGTILAIILLFNNKKKPSKLYEITFFYYLVLFILLFVSKSVLSSFETTVVAAELARAYRDISVMVLITQIPFVLVTFVRGLGFNIKKFDFEKDLKDLEITKEDSEEFELNISHDNYKIRRQLRRFIREFNYYIKENKFIFICICVTLVIVTGYVIFTNLPSNYNNSYRQGSSLVYSNLQITVLDSIVTNLDYNGNIIDNNFYVVLKLKIDNNNNKVTEFKSKNLRLELDKEKYVYPVYDKNSYFIDYGTDYFNDNIPKNSSGIYSLIYKIDKNDIRNRYTIKIHKGTTHKKKEYIDMFDYIKIHPTLIDTVNTVREVNQNDELVLNDSNLNNTKISFSNYEITSKYVYDYEYCFKEDNCTKYKDYVSVSYNDNNKILLVADYKYDLDKETPFSVNNKTFNSFIEKFIKVKYKIGEEEKYSKITNVTPNNLKNKMVIEVDNLIRNSEKIQIAIIVRNKEYLVNLK